MANNKRAALNIGIGKPARNKEKNIMSLQKV
jgi:hypothetical protein